MSDILTIQSIHQFHEILGLPAPQHPLITFIKDDENIKREDMDDSLFDIKFTSDMYTIMYKDKISGALGYGRNSYDFQEGTLVFGAPGQVFTSPKREELQGKEGWTLLFHPDLLLKSKLGESIEEHKYFSYEVSEALHLSDKEQQLIFQVISNIINEYEQNIDKHSQQLIVSNLEVLLNYCLRFYDRQFFTRTNLNSDFVKDFEGLLKDYFSSGMLVENGLPDASFFGAQMAMSPSYLSELLKKETGKGIKEHIDSRVVRKAKNLLLSTQKPVSAIAYDLGFEYPQSFTRLFKKKTGMSPNDFRNVN